MTDPIALLLVGIGVVLVAILWLRLHAFLALALAAFVVAFLTPKSNRLANGFEMAGFHADGNVFETGQIIKFPISEKKKKSLRVGLHLVAKRWAGNCNTTLGKAVLWQICKILGNR